MVEPTPSCSGINGTKSDADHVVGMIKKRLRVSLLVGDRTGWVQYRLQNVLVVDRLPVPIHISWNALDRLMPDRIDSWDEGLLMLQPSLRSTIFPPRFRSHPYWSRGNEVYIGSIASEGLERTLQLTQEVEESATGRPSQLRRGRACATCGTASSDLRVCGRCRAEYYCSTECQRQRWAIHRNTCQRVNG